MGITIQEPNTNDPRERAPRDGAYTVGRERYFVAAGDPLPEGAVLDPAPHKRALPNAPENRREPGVPDNRSDESGESDESFSESGEPDESNEGSDESEEVLDPLGELSNEEFTALAPHEKGQRTKAANAQKDGGES